MIQIIVNGRDYSMKIYRKIHAIIYGYAIKNKCDKTVKVREYGITFKELYKKCIVGNGILRLNANAINVHEVSKLRIDRGGTLFVNGIVSFYSNTNIHIGVNACLSIGHNTYINEGTKISVKESLKIGNNCAISNNVSIMDSDFHTIVEKRQNNIGVIIKDHVWIGADVTILKNVTIGNNCIIGAKSVVTKSIPDNCLAVGNPAKVIKNNIDWN